MVKAQMPARDWRHAVARPPDGSVVDEPSDLVQSVSRALRVLEVVGTSRGGMNAKTVARRCHLNLSTAYHLLRTLSYEGYLVRNPGGDYALGLQIAERFHDLCAALSQPPRVTAVLRRLAAETGQSVYLGRFELGRVAITQVIEAPGSPHLEDLIVGFHDGAHATALGKALLSTLSPQDRAAYLRSQGWRCFTQRTTREITALEHELAAGSAQGLFVEVGQFRRGVTCAATVIAPDTAPDLTWALAVSLRHQAFRDTREPLVAALHRAASELRRAAVPPQSAGLGLGAVSAGARSATAR
jgi:DNA-binding IclR family transcriptional regulator